VWIGDIPSVKLGMSFYHFSEEKQQYSVSKKKNNRYTSEEKRLRFFSGTQWAAHLNLPALLR
jgi:hypothetical protein